jgi:hypothetical protein
MVMRLAYAAPGIHEFHVKHAIQTKNYGIFKHTRAHAHAHMRAGSTGERATDGRATSGRGERATDGRATSGRGERPTVHAHERARAHTRAHTHTRMRPRTHTQTRAHTHLVVSRHRIFKHSVPKVCAPKYFFKCPCRVTTAQVLSSSIRHPIWAGKVAILPKAWFHPVVMITRHAAQRQLTQRHQLALPLAHSDSEVPFFVSIILNFSPENRGMSLTLLPAKPIPEFCFQSISTQKFHSLFLFFRKVVSYSSHKKGFRVELLFVFSSPH